MGYLVETNATGEFAGNLLLGALDGCGHLAFAFLCGLFIKLTTTDFSERIPAFSQERLKRRSAISKGSFSFTRTFGIQIPANTALLIGLRILYTSR
jgi:hypothetical protein